MERARDLSVIRNGKQQQSDCYNQMTKWKWAKRSWWLLFSTTLLWECCHWRYSVLLNEAIKNQSTVNKLLICKWSLLGKLFHLSVKSISCRWRSFTVDDVNFRTFYHVKKIVSGFQMGYINVVLPMRRKTSFINEIFIDTSVDFHLIFAQFSWNWWLRQEGVLDTWKLKTSSK